MAYVLIADLKASATPCSISQAVVSVKAPLLEDLLVRAARNMTYKVRQASVPPYALCNLLLHTSTAYQSFHA